MSEKKGLNSLNERLQRLESLRIPESIVEDTDDQLSKLVSKIKNKEQENKKMTMRSILEHFTDDIKETVLISNDNIVKIIIFSIRYVEHNHLKLCGYLNIKSSSEVKHELCKSLVHHVCKIDSNEMFDLSIFTLCNEIYPSVKKMDEILPEPTEGKKKKSFFSKK